MHLFLLDDDAKLIDSLKRGFEEAGHRCEAFQSSQEGLRRLLSPDSEEPDLLLLDVMMPELTGWDVLKRLREANIRTPAIFLTARQAIEDRVHGLEIGADDYVIKPFAFAELSARIQAVLRRHGYQEPIEVGPLTVVRNRPRVLIHGAPLEVSAREHGFLELLAESPARVFTRAELLEKLWDIQFDPGTNVVDVLVARLRRKLGPDRSRWIETVVGEGYRLGDLGPS